MRHYDGVASSADIASTRQQMSTMPSSEHGEALYWQVAFTGRHGSIRS
jgi:hypothetical protein